MNRQKARLCDDLKQILKDKEAILGKIEELVKETDETVASLIEIDDARKFRKCHSKAKSVLQNTVKIIDRLFTVIDGDDADDEADDDEEDPNETKTSFDEYLPSKSRAPKCKPKETFETNSDLIRLSSDDAVSPPLLLVSSSPASTSAKADSSFRPEVPILEGAA